MAKDRFVGLLWIGMGTVQMLPDNARCDCDMAAGTILVSLLVFIEGLLGRFSDREWG